AMMPSKSVGRVLLLLLLESHSAFGLPRRIPGHRYGQKDFNIVWDGVQDLNHSPIPSLSKGLLWA
ncbi:MAG: hypothetical protein KAT75_08985, partial [Dehalococcoidia bacterium]|nr:hypothetical protein [Dehalococcoidia bacterium]